MVRFIGVCNYNCLSLYDLLSYCSIKPVVNQVELHIYNQQPELVDFCQSQDILPVAYAPLGSDALQVRKVVNFDIFKEPIIHNIATKHNVTNSQVMLAWLRQRKVAVIPKTQKVEKIQEFIGSLAVVLDQQDMEEIQKLNWNMRLFDCHFEHFFPVFK